MRKPWIGRKVKIAIRKKAMLYTRMKKTRKESYTLLQLYTSSFRAHTTGQHLRPVPNDQPTLITEVKCSPGLGDHDLVSAKALLKPSQHKQKTRQCPTFSKADWPKLKSKMKEYQQSFISNHLGKTVEELWTDFTTTLDKFSQECLPSKLIRGKSSQPWIDTISYLRVSCKYIRCLCPIVCLSVL